MTINNQPSMPEVIKRISNSEDRQLAWQFFIFFSRFEYALKRSGKYLKKDSDFAEADWDNFAKDFSRKFSKFASPELQQAVDYFIESPPRKLKRKGTQIEYSEPWKYNSNNSNYTFFEWLLLSIRTVRNNLFHGGKFPGTPISDPSRDRVLLYHSITILNHCFALDDDVKNHFETDIEL